MTGHDVGHGMADGGFSAPGLLGLAVLLVAAAISVARLLRHGRAAPTGHPWTDRESDASHLVMNLVMAAMLTPWFGAAGRTAVLVLLAALLAGLGSTLLAALLAARPGRTGSGAPPESRPARPPGRAGALVYHLVAAAVMLAAVAAMPGGPGVPLTVAGWLFALDALVTLGVAVAAPALTRAPAGAPAEGSAPPVAPPPSALGTLLAGTDPTTLRVAAVPHVVMDVAMVAMLLG